MALTRDFKQTVSERVERDPAFAQALLDEAQRSNLDVQQALARVQQARAGAQAQGSRLLPTLSLGATASDAGVSWPGLPSIHVLAKCRLQAASCQLPSMR